MEEINLTKAESDKDGEKNFNSGRLREYLKSTKNILTLLAKACRLTKSNHESSNR